MVYFFIYHRTIMTQKNSKSVTYGRFDTILFLTLFLTCLGTQMKNSEFTTRPYSLIHTRIFSRFPKSAKKPCFFWG